MNWHRVLPHVCAFLLLGVACESGGSAEGESSASSKALEPTTAECAACGMVVREQPAPRGQLVHRDGTRAFFCSLGDLAQYAQAPSPHGSPRHVFVEVLGEEEDPKVTNRQAHDWLAADQAFYVLGVERHGVMGPPVLAYRSRDEAERVAHAHGGHVVDFDTLQKELLSD